MPPVSLIPLPVKAFTWRCTVRRSPRRWRIVRCATVCSLPTTCGAIVSYIVRHFVINTASAPSFNWGSVSHGWRIVSSTVWRVAPRWRILRLAWLAILYRQRLCLPGVLPRRSCYEEDVQGNRLRFTGEWNGFVDEHNGNIIPNGIEILPILTHQTTVNRFGYRCAAAVGELSLTYTIIETFQ